MLRHHQRCITCDILKGTEVKRNHWNIPVVAHFELQQPPARVDTFLNVTAADAGHAVPTNVDLQSMKSATVVS